MRLTEEEINLAKSGDAKSIQRLIDQYLYMIKSPAYDAVLTLRVTIGNWTKEILEEEPSILGLPDGLDETTIQDKAIERVRKILLDLPQLVNDCEALQAKLTGDDLQKLNTDRRIKEGEDRPFRG